MAEGSYQAVIGNFPPHLPEATFQKENNRMTWQEHTFTLRLQFWEDLHHQLQAPGLRGVWPTPNLGSRVSKENSSGLVVRPNKSLALQC